MSSVEAQTIVTPNKHVIWFHKVCEQTRSERRHLPDKITSHTFRTSAIMVNMSMKRQRTDYSTLQYMKQRHLHISKYCTTLQHHSRTL